MRTIWKFPLRLVDRQVIDVPQHAQLLTVQSQEHGGVLEMMLWAVVDPQKPKVARQVWVVGTGNPFDLPDGVKYLGTVQDVFFVWHVFIEKEQASHV